MKDFWGVFKVVRRGILLVLHSVVLGLTGLLPLLPISRYKVRAKGSYPVVKHDFW